MGKIERKICGYTFEEFIERVKAFHGSCAPGVIIGGVMVDVAQKHLPPGRFYDAICETSVCLPDAVQILTPCTIGNGWLSIVDFGRFAIILYDKETGEGVRVHLDPQKLSNFPEIEAWFLKKKAKKEQAIESILREIRAGGEEILRWEKVRIRPETYRRPKLGAVAICPVCGEAYPAKHGEKCLACVAKEKEAQAI
ncbi:MAG TPA: formylmethanofuran dehydrogenase subunit E family protein [Syntrophales bacterium]|nr:formylmethanofuran dehydrogenase subunit E family protein [Syntrophales bacterium]HOL59764.1 formylmethanofuran dehydrogenase subunit E family protein [Syntrophales bacterium]HPO35926.1 formylmethanofuran dehydrogenase subunit E family protein [Syntrophales bacterium]